MEAFDPDSVERPVFAVEQAHDALSAPWLACDWARLIHAKEGVLSVRTETCRWTIPPHHAVWMPPGVLHCMSTDGPVRLHLLYVRQTEVERAMLPAQSGAVAVDRLVDALLTAVAALPQDAVPADSKQHDTPADSQPLDTPAARLVQVLLDRLPGLPSAPLGLSLPRDPRIQRIADVLCANPAEQAILEDLADTAGVTARTAARLFVKETGQTFGQWRQQLRLLVALQRLGACAGVTQVAGEVGYNDVSSFIAVFRDAFGDTPARYFR